MGRDCMNGDAFRRKRSERDLDRLLDEHRNDVHAALLEADRIRDDLRAHYRRIGAIPSDTEQMLYVMIRLYIAARGGRAEVDQHEVDALKSLLADVLAQAPDDVSVDDVIHGVAGVKATGQLVDVVASTMAAQKRGAA